jgi:hypothetical protein
MPSRFARILICLAVVTLVAAGAAGTASAQTCIAIDERHDTLGRDERAAALLLVRRQFELAGQPVAERDCVETYTLSHVRLGATIVVTLSGPKGSREATAIGLDDLPAVYSQMVRSLMTGQPVGSLSVIDRTNVTAAQDLPARRLRSEGYWYARVGHGSIFAKSNQHAGAFGFGHRAEFDRIGLDFSFFNMQVGDGAYSVASSSAMTLVKLQGLYYLNPTANRTGYFGGGLSYGRADIRGASNPTIGYLRSGRGAGLQGELTMGYEIARATSARVFAQADVTLPFYHVQFESYSYPEGPPIVGRYVSPTVTIERQYAPSLVVSIGFGWQRRR